MDNRVGDYGRIPPGTGQTTLPFVGRQQQLQWLDTCVQETVTGHPSVILVAGESGVGKTRLIQEIRTLAQQHRVKVYYGRCYEDIALPYLPFIRTVFEEVLQEGQTLPPGMHDAAEVMRRFLYPDSHPAPAPGVLSSAPADQGKLRLFLAVSRAIVLLAQSQPCILVADDLHWADSPTLDLFTHLVFSLADTAMRQVVPLCLIATYRPGAAVERLGRLLARLERETICHTIKLSGLNEIEVHQLIQHLDVGRPSHQLVTTVHQVTQGNPLFIQEMTHHLQQHGALQERGGFVVTTTSLVDIQLPRQIRTALAARSQDVSAEHRHIFALAACLGERFSLRLLSAISEVDEERLLDILEDGMHQHFFVSQEQNFQFAHPLIRSVFLNALSTARQQRLHDRIVQVMEQLYGPPRGTRLLDVARHLIAAGAVAEPGKVLCYARQAGDQAFAMFSWSVAAQYYEAALAAASSVPTCSACDQGQLHYQAGLAYHRNQDVGPCMDHYDKAIAAYQLTDDVVGLAHVLLEKMRVQYTLAGIPPGTILDVQPLEAIIPRLPASEMKLTGEIAGVLAEAYWTAKQTDKAREMGDRALEIGQYLEDNALCAYAHFVIGMAQGQELYLRDSLGSWRESLQYAQRTGDHSLQCLPLPRIPAILTVLGCLAEAEAIAHEACTLTQQSQDWSYHSVALSHLTVLQAIRGNARATQQYTQETLHMVTRSHYPWGGSRALLALAGMHASRGEWDAAHAALTTLEDPGRLFPHPGALVKIGVRVFRLLLQAYTGHPDQEDLESLASNLQRLAGNDTYSIAPYCAMLELADLMGVPTLVQPCFQALVLAVERGALFAPGWPFLIPRVLGMAVTSQGLWEQAETYFRTAQTVAENAGARPELGRTYLDWARLIVARDTWSERQRAAELAQQASAIFHEYDMQPFIQRAAQLLASCQEHFPQDHLARITLQTLPNVSQKDRALRRSWRLKRFLG